MGRFEPRDRIRWATLIRHDRRYRPSEHSVAAEIANRANDRGKAWPSKAYIASKIGVSEKTVQRATRKLVRDGWLKNTKRLGSSNMYELSFPLEQDIYVFPSGQGGPLTEGTDGPVTYIEPESITLAEARHTTTPSLSERIGRMRGQERRASGYLSILRSKDRTLLEVRLAKTLGDDGFGVLSALPPWLLGRLLRRIQDNTLAPEDLDRARRVATRVGACGFGENGSHQQGGGGANL